MRVHDTHGGAVSVVLGAARRVVVRSLGLLPQVRLEDLELLQGIGGQPADVLHELQL